MRKLADPFGTVLPGRKLTHVELIRARCLLNLAATHKARSLCTAYAEGTDHPLTKKALIDVANGDREHAGEFGRLLEILTGEEVEWLAAGAAEADEMAAARGPWRVAVPFVSVKKRVPGEGRCNLAWIEGPDSWRSRRAFRDRVH